jgi:NAD(P)H-flavin reductase
VWRPYSVACAPRDDGLLIFHVKAVPGGWVSNALVRDTSVGDGLLLGPAVGKMIAPRPGRRLVCVAGGTGLAPLKALVEQDLRDSSAAERRGIFLFFGARRAAELYDLTALRELARRCPWVHVYPVVSDDRGYRGLQGQVGDVAARLMPRIGCEAYLSGPPDMIRKAAAKLATAGIPERRLHHDLAAPRA